MEVTETNIDLLGKRYHRLMTATLPDVVYLATESGKVKFWLKAFKASGQKQKVDGYFYYTQVKDTLVLELGVDEGSEMAHPERFTYMAHREEGYLANYPSGMRYAGMWEEWYKPLSELMDYFERLVGDAKC